MATKRVKPKKEPKFKTLLECDAGLFQIAQLQQSIKKEEIKLEKAINAYKKLSVKKIGPMLAQIKVYQDWIREYADAHPEEFKNKKTCEITFGSFGFRLSTKISVKNTTLSLLKKLRWKDYIRVKETPDKEKMHGMTDEQLLRVDAKRVETDEFWYEINEQNVAEKLAHTKEA
jgi:phage host-nuclease inhibitor protein Gam